MTQPEGNLGFRRISWQHAELLSGECSRIADSGSFDVAPLSPGLIAQPTPMCIECGAQVWLTNIDDSNLVL